MKHSRERGDTLIEVLLAMAVLAMVTVGAFSLLSKGTTQMYDSMERSEVRALVNQQTDFFTYARDQYLRSQQENSDMTAADIAAAQVWSSVKSATSLSTVPASSSDGCTTSGAFYAQQDGGGGVLSYHSATNSISSSFPSPGDGIYVQKMTSASSISPAYVDLYIRACWQQTSGLGIQVISSIVRLYDY